MEFLVVFPLFMILLLMVFDFCRAMYTWNSLVETTRRGAKMAVICPTTTDPTAPGYAQEIIKKVATFDATGINAGFGAVPVVYGLVPEHFKIIYYDEAGNDITGTTNDIKIKFVEVALKNTTDGDAAPLYQFQFLIPGMHILVDSMPSFKTTLYAESKGAIPYYPGEATPNPIVRCNF